MRIPLSSEINELLNKINPYMYCDSNGMKLNEDAPEDIKIAFERYMVVSKEQKIDRRLI